MRELVLAGLRSGSEPGKSFPPDTPQPLIYPAYATDREKILWPRVVISRPTG